MSDEQQGGMEPEGPAVAPPPFEPTPPPAAPQAPMPSPGTGDGPASDTSKILAALGYIFGVIAIVAILIEPYKDEKFVRFHAVQAIGLWIAGAVLSMAAGIIGAIPVIGWMIAMAAGLAGLVIFVFAIIAAIKAFGGEYYEMPLIHGLVKQYI